MLHKASWYGSCIASYCPSAGSDPEVRPNRYSRLKTGGLYLEVGVLCWSKYDNPPSLYPLLPSRGDCNSSRSKGETSEGQDWAVVGPKNRAGSSCIAVSISSMSNLIGGRRLLRLPAMELLSGGDEPGATKPEGCARMAAASSAVRRKRGRSYTSVEGKADSASAGWKGLPKMEDDRGRLDWTGEVLFAPRRG